MRKYQINIDSEQVNEKPGKNDPVFAVISNRVARHRENLSMSKIIHEIGENGSIYQSPCERWYKRQGAL